jgi:hypothetical protein
MSLQKQKPPRKNPALISCRMESPLFRKKAKIKSLKFQTQKLLLNLKKRKLRIKIQNLSKNQKL